MTMTQSPQSLMQGQHSSIWGQELYNECGHVTKLASNVPCLKPQADVQAMTVTGLSQAE